MQMYFQWCDTSTAMDMNYMSEYTWRKVLMAVFHNHELQHSDERREKFQLYQELGANFEPLVMHSFGIRIRI